MQGRGARAWLLPLAVFVVSTALYGLNGRHGWLHRDDSIFVYSGQQLANGVPPYVSTFHAKTPLSPLLCGLGVVGARAVGADDLAGVRTTYLLVSAAAAVAVSLLASALFGSPATGLVAAAVFVAFWGFGLHAYSGPRPKTLVVLFATCALWLSSRRRFGAAGMSGSLAFLTWQPMGIYVAIPVALAALQSEAGSRMRAAAVAIAGAAIPGMVVLAGLAAAGALPAFFGDTLVFNLFHLDRRAAPLLERLGTALQTGYPDTWPLVVGGIVLCALFLPWRLARSGWSAARVLREDPFAGLLLGFVAVLAWTVFDFQSYPDFYPLLPYAALGCAGGLHLALARWDASGRLPAPARWGAPALACLALVAFSAHQYAAGRSNALVLQRQWSEQLAEIAGPDGAIVSLGVPQPLVLLGRTNPNRFVFLCCGMESYVGSGHPDGFDGWLRDLVAAEPAMIVLDGFGGIARRLEPWVERHRRVRVGRWAAYVRSDRAGEEP